MFLFLTVQVDIIAFGFQVDLHTIYTVCKLAVMFLPKEFVSFKQKQDRFGIIFPKSLKHRT